MTERRIVEEIGPIIVDPKLADELGVPTIIMPEESTVTLRRICGKCGYGFYWPPLFVEHIERHKDLCLRCDRLLGKGEPEGEFDPCTIEDMLEIST